MTQTSWIQDAWFSSPHTYASEVQSELQFPKNIELLDLSLDENGEGMSGARLTEDQKIVVAELLDGLGVHRIGVLGYPAALTPEETSNLSKEVVTAKRISRTVKKAQLVALATTSSDIERAAECDVSQVVIRQQVAHVTDVERQTNEQKVEHFLELATLARKNGLGVAMMAQSITRADFADIEMILTAAHREGMLDEVCLTDSQGVGTPQGFRYLVKSVKGWVDVPIQLHCHNHLGLGVANACFGVAAGASVIHTTVHGHGHFAGMAALEEVAVALAVGYGVKLDLKYEKLFELSQVMQRFTGIQVPPHKPVVGMRAFVLTNDAYYNQVNMDRLRAGVPRINTLPYLPEMVGNRERVYLGDGLTRNAVMWNLILEGLEANADQIAAIFLKVNRQYESKGRPLTDDEFKEIANEVILTGDKES